MRTETLERVLHDWPAWLETINTARHVASYDPQSAYEKRLDWRLQNFKAFFPSACIRALTSLSLPRSFARYWICCFLADYQQRRGFDFEKIRIPKTWLDEAQIPVDPAPAGCWKIEAGYQQLLIGEKPTQDVLNADAVRIFPPQLVSVTIPKWLNPETVQPSLSVALLPLSSWRMSWRDHAKLPLLTDAPDNTSPWYALVHSSGAADADLSRWKRSASIDVPTWAFSENVLVLGA